MKFEAFFVFLIILLGLILFSFLGTSYDFSDYSTEGFTSKNDTSNLSTNKQTSNFMSNTYDNYDHYKKTYSQVTNEITFIGPNGEIATISTNNNGKQIIKITKTNGGLPTIMFMQTNNNQSGPQNKFVSHDGATAKIITESNGQKALKIKKANGKIILFKQSGSRVNEKPITSTQYYGSTGSPIQESSYSLAYQPNVQTVGQFQTNNAGFTSGMAGGAMSGSYDYSSSLPKGIPASLIPPGQKNLYILKSEVVPPVCPACPSASVCPKQEKCPPCPACARCPEPSFECKKVPNYNASANNEYLPIPVLNDFSSFGM